MFFSDSLVGISPHPSDEGVMKTLLLFSCVLFLSLSASAKRSPAGADLEPPQLSNPLKDTEEILRDVKDPLFPTSCVSYLSKLEKGIDEFDVKKFSLSQLSAEAEKIAENSWKIRQHVHHSLDQLTPECVEKVQTTFRQLRFVEDYFLEIGRKIVHQKPSEIDFLKQEFFPIRDTSPAYFHFQGQGEFKSGDLFISRGLSFLSAMIARLGKRPTQFSHVVSLYEDPQEKKIKTIESYVGVGVSFYDLDYALKNENGRILWLRSKDEKLGERAVSLMGAFVKERLDKKNPIKYDYDLDFKDHTTMSCAEVSQAAFQMASDGEFTIPFYPNEIVKGEGLIKRLNLVRGKTFEPGDMEIDPRFTLIGEFRDLRVTRDQRQKDAIMSAIFKWMDEHQYELKDNFKAKMAGGMIHKVRKTFLWPVVKKMLKLEDFSKEIPSRMLKTMSLINDLGEGILVELKKRDDTHLKEFGIPMTHIDLSKELDKMRDEDLKTFENKKLKKTAFIHNLLRK